MKNIFIENGWTFATYKCKGIEYNLLNSHLIKNDVLKKLLSLIYSFIIGEKEQEYVIWNEESKYYVFEYRLKKSIIDIKLYICNDLCYDETISNNAFNKNKMVLVTSEEKLFWNWAEETFYNIECFYDNQNKKEIIRPIDLENKIKKFFK